LSRRTQRFLVIVTNTALALVGAVLLLGLVLGGSVSTPSFVVSGAITLVVLTLGLAVNRPKPLGAWIAFIGAVVSSVAGGVAWDVAPRLGDFSSTRPLTPDLVLVPAYPLLALALVLMARRHPQKMRRGALVDAAVVGLGFALLAWWLTTRESYLGAPVNLAAATSLIWAPTASTALASLGLRYAFSRGIRASSASDRFVAFALVTFAAADVLYFFMDLHAWEGGAATADTLYSWSLLLMMLAALHPSVHDAPKAPSREPYATVGLGVMVAALAALVVVALVEVDPETLGESLVTGTLGAAFAVTVVLKVFRMLHLLDLQRRAMRHQANHDALTGLPNRPHLLEVLEDSIKDARGAGTDLALMFLDLDRFKHVNDAFGHASGDQLLCLVASRLKSCVRSGDVVARLGGDEFVVVLPEAGPERALEVAARIHESFSLPFDLGSNTLTSATSIGVVTLLDNLERDAPALLEAADTALYRGKREGRGRSVLFDTSMREEEASAVALESALGTALADGYFSVHYQPLVDASSEEVVSVEALLRLNHPDLGSVPPTRFIPIAEETGLIFELGRWVLEHAAHQVASWRARGSSIKLSVNVSPLQLTEPGFADQVASVLVRTGLDPKALDLEITESLLLSGADHVLGALNALRDLGVTLSVDDFGTGYSSLAYLKRFPVQRVKVDRSFVSGLEDPGSNDAALVGTIVAMAASMDLATVAEGVETEAQARRLAALGVDVLQGFRYARPQSAEQLEASLRTQGPPAGIATTTAPVSPVITASNAELF
jgi:diguanylate cyclase (GGDEF)-like protein